LEVLGMATQPKDVRKRSERVAHQNLTEGSASELWGVWWRKSSFSSGGECVSVAGVGGEVALRNSNRPDGGTLVFSRGELAAWIAGVKAGEFDDLTA
jgi:hypothetical protein